MVEGAALEMLCGETHLGFESLTLRQTKQTTLVVVFFVLQSEWKGIRRTSGTEQQSGELLRPRATKRPQAREPNPYLAAKKPAKFRLVVFFYPSRQAWYIIAARSVVHIIKVGKPTLHLITRQRAFRLRLDDIQNFVLMICNSLRN